MRWIGITLIIVSTGSVGFGLSRSLQRRCMLMHQLLKALDILKNEIHFCATPLPQAFALMAVSVPPPLETVFSHAARQMDKHRWMTPYAAMEQALQQTQDAYIGAVLLSLSAQLGEYDTQAQLHGIALAQEQARDLLQQLEKERSLRSRTYETLGICTGLAVAILLL